MEKHIKYANKLKSRRVRQRLEDIKYIENEDYKGYISFLKMVEVERPFIRKIGLEDVCFGNSGYVWIQTFEEGKPYSITIMYDENQNVVQWYVDIIKSMGICEGVPYVEDFYLDMDILPNGEIYILDCDELEEALLQGVISKIDYDFAYESMNDLKNKIEKNMDFLLSESKRALELFEELL